MARVVVYHKEMSGNGTRTHLQGGKDLECEVRESGILNVHNFKTDTQSGSVSFNKDHWTAVFCYHEDEAP